MLIPKAIVRVDGEVVLEMEAPTAIDLYARLAEEYILDCLDEYGTDHFSLRQVRSLVAAMEEKEYRIAIERYFSGVYGETLELQGLEDEWATNYSPAGEYGSFVPFGATA